MRDIGRAVKISVGIVARPEVLSTLFSVLSSSLSLPGPAYTHRDV